MSTRTHIRGSTNARARRQGGHVTEMQRRRLLGATVELLAERGVQAVNVAVISQRAGVSRKTFYDIFADREACLCAAFEEVAQRIELVVLQAAVDQRRWRDRMRAGLAALLAFLEQEPAAGRLAIVEALGAGEPSLQARRQVLDRLTAAVDEGRGEARRGQELPPLTAEGVVGAVLSVIQARMLNRDPRPLGELAGPLTAMIFQPYLGVSAAQKEIHASAAATVTLPAIQNAQRDQARAPAGNDPFKDLPMRLTYRTALVLSVIAELGRRGSCPSSKQVATAAGVSDQGQMSRLLARLQRFGLVENTGGQPVRGEAKAWALTSRGEGVLRAVGEG